MSNVHKISVAYQEQDEDAPYAEVRATTYTETDPLHRELIDAIEVTVYWHTPPEGDPILVVDVSTEASPYVTETGNPTNVRVNVNDGTVYDEEV
jgi:hypothetical protein